MTKAHGRIGQWWVTIDGHGGTKYPSIGHMRIDNNNHYYQVYRRSKKKSDDLIEAIERMGVVVAAYEELLENGAYKRITPDGHYGLFKVLKPDIQYVGMLKIVQFDLGDCILPLDG